MMTSVWLDDFRQDIRYAIRTLRRSPTFAATALLTFALGIGATTAVFSVVYGVLLRPLPYAGADRLVRVWEEHPGGTTAAGNRWISNRTYYAWVDHPRTIDVLGAYGTFEETVRFNADDVRLFGARISPALMNALGPRPLVGRLFTTGDAEPGADHAVLLSESIWRERFAGDPAVVGRPLGIDGEPYIIAGVVAGEFHFPAEHARFWTPYSVERVSSDPARSQRTGGISAVARLAPGATASQVEAEGTARARSVPVTSSTRVLFGTGGAPIVRTRPFVADMTGDIKPSLLMLAAAVACLLLIACANVANLFLSRGVSRQRELAVRAAIGAGRGRLVRQLLTESFVLSFAGGLTGLLLAWTLLRLIPVLAPARFPRLDAVHLDARVLAFAAFASFATTFLSGLVPALRGARLNVSESLRGGDGATAGGFRGVHARRLRDGLLVAESAFAVMLLVGAALLARSFLRLTHVDGGYLSEGVLTARVLMPQGSPPERAGQFAEQALARLRGTAGVTAAGAGNMMPLFRPSAIAMFTVPAAAGEAPLAVRSLHYVITPGYGEALGLHLRAGRFFDDRDNAAGARAMIVNDEFVRRYLTSGPVIGRRFTDPARGAGDPGTEIVGVVGTVLKDGNDRQPQPELYFAAGVPPDGGFSDAVNIVLRTAGDPRSLAGTFRHILRDGNPYVLIERVEPLADPLAASVAQPRFATTVLGAFTLVALALASVGLYGVLSYTVSQRRRELGVRAALGASRAALISLVLREGLAVASVGAGLGLLGAAALTRLMESLLFGVTPLDAVSFALAPLILAPAALAACLVPALRAAAVGPAEALRGE